MRIAEVKIAEGSNIYPETIRVGDLLMQPSDPYSPSGARGTQGEPESDTPFLVVASQKPSVNFAARRIAYISVDGRPGEFILYSWQTVILVSRSQCQ